MKVSLYNCFTFSPSPLHMFKNFLDLWDFRAMCHVRFPTIHYTYRGCERTLAKKQKRGGPYTLPPYSKLLYRIIRILSEKVQATCLSLHFMNSALILWETLVQM